MSNDAVGGCELAVATADNFEKNGLAQGQMIRSFEALVLDGWRSEDVGISAIRLVLLSEGGTRRMIEICRPFGS
jgi:hypothetical protein